MLVQLSCDFHLTEGGFEPGAAGGSKPGAPATA